MKMRDDIDVGAATHTGPVRSANEDDFLVFESSDAAMVGRLGRLFVLADGMGGVAGGAEASRIAVRTLSAEFARGVESLDESIPDLAQLLNQGFDRSARAVYDASRETPQLADMGTTMTALALRGSQACVAHVGDTRCLLLRDGQLQQLTEDHAVEEPRHLLTRCLGAGRDAEVVDVLHCDAQTGDIFLLLSDGVWGAIEPVRIAQLVRSAAREGGVPAVGSGSSGPLSSGVAQRIADRLVQAALAEGTTDNATAVVVRVRDAAGLGQARDVDVARDEAAMPLAVPDVRVVPRRWPWLLIAIAMMVAAAALYELFVAD